MTSSPREFLLAGLLTLGFAQSQEATASGTPGQSTSAKAPLGQLPRGCALAQDAVASRSGAELAAPAFLPTQLEIRTPLAPTAFPSAGRTYVIYELHLRNFAGEPLELQTIEVLGGNKDARPLATFGAEQLPSLVFPRADEISTDEANSSRQLASGQGTVAYLCLAFEPGLAVPAQLRHRVHMKAGYADGPSISTSRSHMRTLAPPVEGLDWIAAGGPGNTSHHRVGLLVIGGNARISRRYAIDWRQVRGGANFAGDALDLRSYHAYGQQVFAVADGTVISAKDGLPNNVPRTSKGFATAVPITMETIAGNAITLDLGNGQFAYYAHLQPGSLRVRKGERVKSGDVLGRIGNSGDSREPHLHFEVTDSPDLLAGEGLPYLIDRYDIRLPGGELDDRVDELPTLETLTNFRAR